METSINYGVTLIYRAFFNRMRIQMVNSIEEGDVSLNSIREQLMEDFEIINHKLDRMMDAHVKVAKDHLTAGLLWLNGEHLDRAMQEFDHANSKAMEGFHTSTSFELKIWSIKISILSTLHLSNYFNPALRDVRTTGGLLLRLWKNLLDLPEVQSTLRDEFGSSVFRLLGSSKDRRLILHGISEVKLGLEALNLRLSFSVLNKKGDHLLLESARSNPQKWTAHKDLVAALTVQGNRLYSASWDNTIKVWDISEGMTTPFAAIATLLGHTGPVKVLTLQGNRLYSGSHDCTIKIWDISEGTWIPSDAIATLTGHSYPLLALVVQGKRLYSASSDNTIKVWDISEGMTIRTDPIFATLTGHCDAVVSLAVNGNRLYSGSNDYTIKIWDISEGTMTPSAAIATLTGHRDAVIALVVQEKRLFSGSHDCTIKVWDISEGLTTPIATLSGHSGYVVALVVNENRLYSGSYDGSIKLWDISEGTTIPLAAMATLTDHKNSVQTLALQGNKLFASDLSGTIYFYLR